MLKKDVDNFASRIKNLKDYIALATVPAALYNKTNIKIVKYFIEEEDIPGVYITLNKPYKTVQSILKKSKIDTRLVIFIDCVTRLADNSEKKSSNCLFIGSPEKLSDISIAMDQAVRAIPSKQKFVFFDSLSTLLLYNNAEIVARFIHFLASKMRMWKVKGIIISLEKDKNKDLIDKLAQVCDIVVDIGGEK
ncbi:MAG TPA: ATPase domain-containing protein [Candidatus Nanoarchaeia archaeon]|nr:ATPase domain-containing protein [Candidatus Nanoarchaeia archaeon]